MTLQTLSEADLARFIGTTTYYKHGLGITYPLDLGAEKRERGTPEQGTGGRIDGFKMKIDGNFNFRAYVY